MDHRNLAVIRGDRKNPSLKGPALEQYRELYRYVASVWKDREEDASARWWSPCCVGQGQDHGDGPAVRPLHRREPHRRGVRQRRRLRLREPPPLGNLRQKSFFEIWDSPEAEALRASIRARECHCTTEVFLWPSVVFQPVQLAKAAVGAKLWRPVPTEEEYRRRS
jgi:hypothetical protein